MWVDYVSDLVEIKQMMPAQCLAVLPEIRDQRDGPARYLAFYASILWEVRLFGGCSHSVISVGSVVYIQERFHPNPT